VTPPVAVVTGAGSGLGAATARRLARDGYRVACLDIDEASAARTAAHLADSGAPALAARCDVSDEASAQAAVDAALERFGAVDALVTAAGVAHAGHYLDLTLDEWRRLLDVNLTGTFVSTKACLPALLRSRGAIVTVASTAALRGWRYMAGYAAAKGGIVALSRTLAVEFGRAGVRVNCVCPGSIDTPLRDALQPVPGADPELLARARPLADPPVAQPEEIASSIAFLLSPASRFVTGTVQVIDGGALA
jgi:NAD(P)-dependent dehydrogenase (short-subunit alcohol dehydrogenase family)